MKTIIAIAAATLALTAGHALAQTAADGASTLVSYRDLDLSTQAGRSALEGRVNAAVDQVCPSQDERRLEVRQYEQVCRSTALAGAHQQLAAVYSRRELAQAAIQVSSRR
jgi:UrcA family protein